MKVDMSPSAVEARLAEVGALNRLCDSLAAAGAVTSYELPDPATLAKYMHLLQAVLIAIRGSTDPEAADLAYAVHNLPDLLLRWSDMDEAAPASALRRFEAKYPRWRAQFTRILEEGGTRRLAARLEAASEVSGIATALDRGVPGH